MKALSTLALFCAIFSNAAFAQSKDLRPGKEIVLDGLKRPWSIAFISENEAVISEKEGGLIRVDLSSRQRTTIKGLPDDVPASGDITGTGDNKGLFDVLLAPDFKKSRLLYLAYAAKNRLGTATKVIRGILDNDLLRDIQTLFIATPYTSDASRNGAGFHYGGGMIFGADGKLYLTIGERLFNEIDEPPLPIAQNIADRRGKIYRLNPDGSIPADNPRFGAEAIPGLYATGIRAAQGITLHPETGKIWFSEHGTHQGDEINILEPGANYGWPNQTTGKYRSVDYIPPILEGRVYSPPAWYWLQTVAPTGLVFYTGDEFPAWKNDLFVAGLSRGSLWRFDIEGSTIKNVEELFVDDRVRLRKVTQSPNGRLYLLTDEMNGKLIRITNARGKNRR